MSGVGPSHLVLLVPGLLGPLRSHAGDDDACRALLAGLDTRLLEQLLSRADRLPRGAAAAGIETAVCEVFGLAPAQESCPVAALTRQMDAGDAGTELHLRADPVHLQAGMTEVTLLGHSRPAPGLAITTEETPLLLAAVNEALADEGLQVEALAAGRWYLRLPCASGARFTSLYDVAGGSLREALPGGAEGSSWRRLLTATQTALHACPVNTAREAAGVRAVNSLWFFGEGRLPATPAQVFDSVCSDHELAAACASHAGTESRPLPVDAAVWLAGAGPGRHLLLLEDCLDAGRRADTGGWAAALETLQRRWLAPLADAMRGGDVATLTLLTGDAGAFSLDRRALRRFWRRNRLLAGFAAETASAAR